MKRKHGKHVSNFEKVCNIIEVTKYDNTQGEGERQRSKIFENILEHYQSVLKFREKMFGENRTTRNLKEKVE